MGGGVFRFCPFHFIMTNRFTVSTLALILATLTGSAQEIWDFTSIHPSEFNPQYITIPQSHAFQLLFQWGDPLTEGGTVGRASDFAGYLPIEGSSRLGYLSVNSEFVPGSVSVHNMRFNDESNLWNIEASGRVDFSEFNCPIPLTGSAGTIINCSGGITPWGTVVTCEEAIDPSYCSYDGYRTFGWNIEFDPATRTVIDHDGDGRPDKLWAMGRMKHENVCFTSDSLTVYYGDDNSTSGYIFRYVMHQKANLSSGDLSVLQLDPATMSCVWIPIANQSKADRNNAVTVAADAGATAFERVEDVEIGPDGKIYFASTGNHRIYRVNQDGSDFEIYIDNIDIEINYGNGTEVVRFAKPDNLCFDGAGNLWVNQDGGTAYVWVIDADHTMANPKVRVFGNVPDGGESTGITFTPDYRYMFMSVQHPETTNSTVQQDITGQNIVFDRDATVVIARKEYLGAPASLGEEQLFSGRRTYIDRDGLLHLSFYSLMHGNADVQVLDIGGRKLHGHRIPVHVGQNNLKVDMRSEAAGAYVIQMGMNGTGFSTKVVR